MLWLACLAIIAGLGALLAWRAPSSDARRGPGDRRARGGAGQIVRLVAILVFGAVVVNLIMTALGTVVVHAGPSIDKPVFHWVAAHRVSAWARVMDRLTKIGDTWTTWGACVVAAACLTVSWRARHWLPSLLLAAAIFIDHYTTLALRHTFHRIGPPGSPGGTYPSGGVDRVVLLYGLIAFLLWRGFSGRRRAAVWAGTAVAGLAFNEAYSRGYLTLHWFTDIWSGLLYGTLMLTVFILAARVVLGPADVPYGRATANADLVARIPASTRQAPA